MKIALITDDFYPNLGGIAHTLMNLCKKFKDTEHILYIFNPNYKGIHIYKIVDNKIYNMRDVVSILRKKFFYIYFLKAIWAIIKEKKTPFSYKLNMIMYFLTKPKQLTKIIKNIKLLYQYLRKLDFDLIVGASSGWIFPLNYTLSRMFNKKLISLAHGNDFLVKNPLTFRTYFFKNADKIIISNLFIKRLIKKIHHLKDSQLEVIHRGVNLEDTLVRETKKELREEYNITEDQFVVLSVGRHVPRKNFDLVIRSIREIKEIIPWINLKYYLIGEGRYTPFLRKLTTELNLEKNVEFLGACDAVKRNKFYKLSDVFVMPVLPKKRSIEGFGIVFIEANLYKIPVIGTATGGIIEAILDGETGFLIKPNNLKELVEKLLYFYNNNERRVQMGENGYNRVLNEFTWDKIVNDYIRVFKNVLEQNNE